MNPTRGFLLGLLLAAFTAARAFALDLAPLDKAEAGAPALKAELEQVQRDIAQTGVTAPLLTDRRAAAERIRLDAGLLAGALDGPLAEIEGQLAELGPVPASEAASIAAERNTLEALKARHVAARTSLNLAATGAEQAVAAAAAKLRDLFFRRVLDPGTSILNPAFWSEGFAGAALLGSRLTDLIGAWAADAGRKPGAFGAFLAILAALAGAVVWARRWISRLLERRRASRVQTLMDRLWRVVRRPLTWFLLVFAALLIVRVAGAALGVMTGRMERLIDVFFSVFTSFAVTSSFVLAILAPRQPQWRLVALEDGQAARLGKLAIAAAAILAVRDFIDLAGGFILLPLALSELRGGVSAAGLAAVIFLAVRALDPPVIREQYARMESRRYFGWLRHARLPAFVVVAAAALALLLGYVALADFVTSQFIETLLVLAILYLLHKLIDAFIATQMGRDRAAGRFLRNTVYASESGINRLKVALRTTADLALFLLGLPLLFIQWTVTWVDLPSIASSLLNGISVGGLTISPAAILSAFAVLILGLFASNLFGRWLEGRVLSETEFDKGVKDSVRKGVSYAGITLASGFALAAAGINFSNIAIIAGALGVGIGFGLQSIVNNFVSGLILLAERPVKVGDWVVTTAGEGLVRRIKVRSTEIETFDKCAIIVPNSSLITDSVKNWTHDNYYGRFLVALTTDYGHDGQEICDVMTDAALQHPKVMKEPGPGTILAGFGQMGMNFELRAMVANVFDSGAVASDVRIAIERALRARGVRIPVIQPPPPTGKGK